MQGIQDSANEKKDHAYFVYEVTKCNNKNALPGYGCANENKINEWLLTKKIYLRILNVKIDYTSFDEIS